MIPYRKKKSCHKISSAKKFVGKKFRHFAHGTLSRNKFVGKKFSHWQKSSSFFADLFFSDKVIIINTEGVRPKILSESSTFFLLTYLVVANAITFIVEHQ